MGLIWADGAGVLTAVESSIISDFLGDWLGSNYDGEYAKGRIPTKSKDSKAQMSKHVQVEWKNRDGWSSNQIYRKH